MSDALCFVFAYAIASTPTKHPVLRLRGGRRTPLRAIALHFLYSFKAGENAVITFTFPSAPSEFSEENVSVSGGTLSGLTADHTGKVYTAQFTPTPTPNSNSLTGAISVAQGSYSDALDLPGAASNPLSLKIDTLAPTLSSSSPADGATAVAVGSDIVLTFSETVQAGVGNILLGNGTESRTIPVTDATQVKVVGSTVTLNPTFNLAGSGHYSVQMAGGVFKDLAGNPYAGLNSADQLDFTTAATGSLVLSSDKTNLKALETAVITFTFPEAPIGFTASDVTVSGGTLSGLTADVTGKVYTAKFIPTANTDSLTGTLSVAQGSYTDTLNTPGAAGSNTLSLKIDTLAPTFTSSSPADKATAVAISSNLVLTFSEAVQAGTGNIVITNGADTRTIAVTDTSQVSISGSTVTINPTADLTAGSTYNVQELLSGLLKDLAGNVYTGIGDETTFSFATADTTAPSLTSSSPADNATSVAVSSNIVLTFNETIKAGSGNIVISNGNGDTRTIAVTDTSQVSISGSTVTINPATDLTAGSTYNVQMAGGVIQDMAGNGYAGISDAVTWNFATAVAATTSPYGQVIDLGSSYGKLIQPVYVDGHWYYYWDRTGDGASANTQGGGYTNTIDHTTHEWLDSLFRQDINGVTGGDGNTTNIYRYATLNNVRLVLPTYDDLVILKANNGGGTGTGNDGTPSGWNNGSAFWSATPSALGHAYVYLVPGNGYDGYDSSNFYVALEVLSIDTTAPTVSSTAITSATGLQNSTLDAGDVVSATVTMSEATTVTGTPQLALNIGGTTVQASYASGSGSSALVFNYTILSGQNDANGIGIAVNSLSLNSGALTDAAGNNATLNHAAVADNAGYRVDTSAPVYSSTTTATIAENTASGTSIYDAAADGDTGVTYGLSGIDANRFTIDMNNGIVSLAFAPDYEIPADNGANNVYDFTVRATDAAGNFADQAVALTDVVETGQAVIDLGANYGKLILPVNVDGDKWYYYWDRSGDGTSANIQGTGYTNATDLTSHDALDPIFTQDIKGVLNGGSGHTITHNLSITA